MFKPSVAILLFFCAKCKAQEKFYNRTCESYNVTVVQNFTLNKYAGVWHEISRYNAYDEKNLDCVTANYSSIGEHEIKIKLTAKNLKAGIEYSWNAKGYEQYPQYHEANMVIEFDGKNSSVNYLVIGTDYTNYAVVWSCYNESPNNHQFLWIKSRTWKLQESDNVEIATVLENSHLDPSRLHQVVSNPEVCGCKKHTYN